MQMVSQIGVRVFGFVCFAIRAVSGGGRWVAPAYAPDMQVLRCTKKSSRLSLSASAVSRSAGVTLCVCVCIFVCTMCIINAFVSLPFQRCRKLLDWWFYYGLDFVWNFFHEIFRNMTRSLEMNDTIGWKIRPWFLIWDLNFFLRYILDKADFAIDDFLLW